MENSAIFKFRRGVYASSLVGAFFNFITTLLGVFSLMTPVFSLNSEIFKLTGLDKTALTTPLHLFPVDFLQMKDNKFGFIFLIVMIGLAIFSAILFFVNLITFCSEMSSKSPSKSTYTIIGGVNTFVLFLIGALSILVQFSLLDGELPVGDELTNILYENIFLQNGMLPLSFTAIILFTFQANVTSLMNKNMITNYNFSAKKSTKQDPYTPTIIAYKSKIMLSRVIDNLIAVAVLLIAGSSMFVVLTQTSFMINVDIIGLLTSPLIMDGLEVYLICAMVAGVIAVLGIVLAILGITSYFKRYAVNHELADNSHTTMYSLFAMLVIFIFVIFSIVAVAAINYKQEAKESFNIVASSSYCLVPFAIAWLLFIIKIVFTYLFKGDVIKDIDIKGALSAKMKARRESKKSQGTIVTQSAVNSTMQNKANGATVANIAPKVNVAPQNIAKSQAAPVATKVVDNATKVVAPKADDKINAEEQVADLKK